MNKSVLAGLIGIALASSAVAQQNEADAPPLPATNSQQEGQNTQRPERGQRQSDDSAASEDRYGDQRRSMANGPILEQSSNTTPTSGMKADSALASMDPSDLEGKPIVNADGEEVGDIDSIKVERATKERVAIVGIQGIVGDEMKEVAVPLSQLSMAANGEGLQTTMTKSELEQQADVDPMDDDYIDVDEFEEAE